MEEQQTERERLQRFLRNQHHRDRELIPRREEHEDHHRRDGRPNDRQHDAEERPVDGRAVDAGRFFQIDRHAAEETVEDERRERKVERNVRHDKREIGIRQVKIPHEYRERDHDDLYRHEHADGHIDARGAAQPPFHPGDGIGEQNGERQAEDDRDHGDDNAVHEVLRHVKALPGRLVILEAQMHRQAERIRDENLVIVLQ